MSHYQFLSVDKINTFLLKKEEKAEPPTPPFNVPLETSAYHLVAFLAHTAYIFFNDITFSVNEIKLQQHIKELKFYPLKLPQLLEMSISYNGRIMKFDWIYG